MRHRLRFIEFNHNLSQQYEIYVLYFIIEENAILKYEKSDIEKYLL